MRNPLRIPLQVRSKLTARCYHGTDCHQKDSTGSRPGDRAHLRNHQERLPLGTQQPQQTKPPGAVPVRRKAGGGLRHSRVDVPLRGASGGNRLIGGNAATAVGEELWRVLDLHLQKDEASVHILNCDVKCAILPTQNFHRFKV